MGLRVSGERQTFAGPDASTVGCVIIGRNEGARLIACIESLPAGISAVYVDSASTDGSLSEAESRGLSTVSLDMTLPFSAGRARNAGAQTLRDSVKPEFIQFIDGDCVLCPEWISTALEAMDADPHIAVVCGHTRERYPEVSIYNRIIAREWDAPIGYAKSCGGIAMYRSKAFFAAKGFDPAFIAGEEPELCVRLRQAGGRVQKLDVEMTLHDANMTRISQWWKRAKRAGYAYAMGAAKHGAPPERHYVPQLLRALLWGLVLPLVALAGSLLLSPWAIGLLTAYPIQVVRLGLRTRDLPYAALTVLAKLPEAQGILGWFWDQLGKRRPEIIEYK